MTNRSLAALAAAWCAAIGLAVMQGCGGAVGSGGTGISEGVAQGTVNGFGSVIVDGVRVDDSRVPTLVESEPGVQTQTEARMGARVEVEFGDGAVQRLLVQAALSGAVEVVAAPGGFSLLGQSVRVNRDAGSGPVTQYGGGYAGIDAVRAGDAVEVHGFIVRTATGFSIQATRVDRLSALPRYLKLYGLASAVGPSGFRLGDLAVDNSAATVLPAGRSLAEGQAVSVLAAADSVQVVAGASSQVRAAQVRIRSLGDAGATVAVSGVIALLDPLAFGFDLGGTPVQFAGAIVSPQVQSLADGRYVQVRGTVQADGSIRAEAVRLRDGKDDAEAELKGTVDAFNAATGRFRVRGVTVDATRATLEGCPGSGLADGLFVSVEGALDATTVIAKSVHCENEAADSTVERKGVAESVDTGASVFVLRTTSGAPLTVRWTATTYFKNVGVATLAGQAVEVEGRLVDGVLVAQKIGVEAGDD